MCTSTPRKNISGNKDYSLCKSFCQIFHLVVYVLFPVDSNKVVCYFGSWSVYRPGDGKFDVENIDPMICTHLIFGFAGLGADNKIYALDSYNELEENWGRGTEYYIIVCSPSIDNSV
jgi:GH18 family chitinase